MRLAQQGTPGLDPSAGSIIHFYHFRRWRESGIAYELRDCKYNEVNRTLLSTAYGTRKEYKDRCVSILPLPPLHRPCTAPLALHPPPLPQPSLVPASTTPDFACKKYNDKSASPAPSLTLSLQGSLFSVPFDQAYPQLHSADAAFVTITACYPPPCCCSSSFLPSYWPEHPHGLCCRLGNDKGCSVSAWGFWGDILNSPYHSFGTACKERSFFKISNKQFAHTSVGVAEYNVVVCPTLPATVCLTCVSILHKHHVCCSAGERLKVGMQGWTISGKMRLALSSSQASKQYDPS